MLFAALRDAAAIFFQGRSSRWPAVRRAHLEEHPRCELCGGKKSLNVHHVLPFHTHPGLELEPGNLITLCEKSHLDGLNCHLLFGHLGDWKAFNPHVQEDAPEWRKKILARRYL